MWEKIRHILVRESPSVLLRASGVAGLLIALRLTGLLQLLEWAALDQFFRLRPQEPVDSRIVIVGISESDIQKAGQWPIPDSTIAQLIEKLKQQQPSAIGLDIYRDLPVGAGHQNLIKVLKTTPNLIGVKRVSRDGTGFAVNPSPILTKLDQVGANNLVLDPDGKIRRGLLFLETKNGESIMSFGLKLAFIYLESKGIKPENAAVNSDYLQLAQAVFVRLRANDGSYIRTNYKGYQILMNFRGPQKTFKIVSMTDVLENRVAPDFARNRVVLIGSTALSLQDYFHTPYDSGLNTAPNPTSGVEIHANLISQIISAALDNRPLIKVWSEPLEMLWIFGWSVIGATSVWMGRYAAGKKTYYSVSWTGVTILIAGSLLIGGSFIAFLGGWWIPLVPSVLALAGSVSAITAYIANIERAERQTVMNLFGRHVTPKIAEAIWEDRDKILEEGQLQGQEMIATVLFTDLKGFSSIAEGMEPKVLMSWLNEYMSAMAQIVLDCDGAIDKFIGDAVMAVFGVPIAATTPEEIALDAQKAVKCALGMAEALKSLNRQWRMQGKPTVAMRVGIATGTVVVGSLGSNQRQDYTIIGDTVNIASRLESFDKSIDGGICRILIAEETCQYTQDKFATELIGTVLLKGREQPVKVYQVPVE
ncbi:CHASE2 domain-containing protein [Microcoleus sp. FACHB-672]|uniref:CHASE2 domain-containing protein n=1 Tax=Microcoleus sp. FACHB-672 TaxID=2692825 RepID=UPI0016829C9A|nr:adenylate/guanylate cyclase domain-containing protein [Microcoleus sp. FACHB-672]MBD2041067.1 adenylate/guanylate cyclase domain-containing protein [Microcoleus sp. FACHB-672]